ncbi:flippase [Aerosakkonemataceae cyanobacterium BLCC-F154]|uniref:Flippase n=1 Tax=Floridaenema fluviatile BLCC-F154 TaxID=3153640 RepID=A0ABV4YIK5_9CYAN
MLNKIIKVISEKINPGRRKVFTNISWLLGERVFRMAVSFLLLAWTARYLGVNDFGLLNYAIAFSDMFSPLFQLASSQIVFRDLVTHPSEKEEILGTAALLKFIIGIFVFILAVGTIFFLQPNDSLTIKLVFIISIPSLISGFSIIESWFQSQVEMKYTIWARNSVFIITTLMRIVLLELQAPLIFFAWLVVIESVLNTLGFISIYHLTKQSILAWRANWERAKNLMRISWPLILSSLSIIVYLRIDQVMLGQLADAKAVGIYAIAVRLSEVWPFASTAIVKSVSPSIIAARKDSEEVYYKKIQKLCNLQAALVYCIAIPMTFLSTPLVTLLFGKDFAPAGIVLSIHIWSAMFLFLGYVKEVWIITEGLTGFAFAFSFAGAIMNLILNFLLIPKYREVGAAIATVISYGFADYIMCFLYPPARKFGLIMTQAMTLNLVKVSKV